MTSSKYPLRMRAAMACRIVNLDRVKFNDAVAKGLYPCAPGTMSGSARIFTEEQLLPLFFFARLSEFGVHASKAGKLACEMASVASQSLAEPATRIIYVHGTFSSGFFTPNLIKDPATGEVREAYDPEHETPNEKNPTGIAYPGNGRTLFTVEFYIKHVRELIAGRIAQEISIIGEEEE